MTYITQSQPTFASRNSVRSTLERFYGVWRQRQALRGLDTAALRDIGISKKEAHAEANRSFWDAPETWRC